ncbi:MAG: tRNA (N6-isopentenyl adenosine(37)-C2)-methylthiotransferase MiaB [Bdellovibrionales bacterium]
MTNKPKFLIKSWGCQMNLYDSSRMADLLRPLGYEATEDQTEANLIILNTCHIREKASEKLFSELGRLRALQEAREKEGKTLMLAVAGCVAQAGAEEIKRRAPYVSMIFGPQTYHRLPEMLARAARAGEIVLDTEFPAEPKFDYLPDERGENGVSVFLSVQEGCNRFCSYCVVPYTRGVEYSRPLKDIENEARLLVEQGVKEITLLGQNVNAYCDEDTGAGLGDVIMKLAALDGLLRIRYTTSHPLDVREDLLEAHASVEKLMPYLHLPLQSGSNKILEAMNRKHTSADYLKTIDRLRTAQPALAFSSDFIVGFPGETDQDFEDTMKMVRNVTYAQAFSFKYSRRPGTPAAAMSEQVEEAVKEERLVQLQALLRQQQTEFNDACAGKIMPVLFDSQSDVAGKMFGRTVFMQAVRADGDLSLIGQERNVKMVHTAPNSLGGEVVGG